MTGSLARAARSRSNGREPEPPPGAAAKECRWRARGLATPRCSSTERRCPPRGEAAAKRLALVAMHPHAVGAMGRAQVFNQGLTGFMLQLLKGGSADADREAFGLGFQVAGTFRDHAKHNLSHNGSLACRPHPWTFRALVGVPPLTGIRPPRHPSRCQGVRIAGGRERCTGVGWA